MRKPITIQSKPFELTEDVKQRIQEVVRLFDAYLDEYPVKSARSKHALMGPVAKVLDRAKAGDWYTEPLTGYALRIHEMNPRARGRPVSLSAVDNLEKGTDALLVLCQSVPITALARIVDQVDYHLYYVRRKKGLAWLEERKQQLINWLQERYKGGDEAFAKAWGLKKGSRIGDQYYFGPSSKTYLGGTDQLKADMDAFYAYLKGLGEEPEAVEETEEE